ncbi:hypothetical protein, partial [Priestia megaterium]|uniref:hypothetical protein n=1 Tax=Priestia megaterium TaxID=1404 RepID=UPI002FFF0237
FNTLETVEMDTPAYFATSYMVGFIPFPSFLLAPYTFILTYFTYRLNGCKIKMKVFKQLSKQ